MISEEDLGRFFSQLGVALMQDEVEVFESFLRSKHLKRSKPRCDILEVFLASEGHLSAQELYERAKQKNSRVGFATVYRTLKLLEACGLARAMDYGDGTQRYEPDRFQHHHIICTSCNRTVEFSSPELESLLLQVQKAHRFTPQSHAVRILSVCTDCNQTMPLQSRHGKDLETILSRDALQVAIANEQRGVNFYSQALEATKSKATRTVFARLVDQEKQHLTALQKEYETLQQSHSWLDDEPSLLYFDHERLGSIFPKGWRNIVQIVQSASPAEALYMAMAAERRSHEFFSDYADKMEYAKGKAIFKKFANEEWQHLRTIRHAYDALQDREQGKSPVS
ncbi:MAG: transcriptional repressor [bacterium]|nr:transcriptional repressor [bacterium]